MKIKAFLKNWKTTVLGLGGAVLSAFEIALQGGCGFQDWSCWSKPVLWALLGFVARDADKSTEDSR